MNPGVQTEEFLLGTWTTPRGHTAAFAYRDRTNDWNVLTSCLTNDEYGLGEFYLDDRVALDVGAHIGGVTVALALDNPLAHVYAIEPVPENLELLYGNLERNGVRDRVTVLPGAVGTDSVTFDFGGDETATHNAWIGNAHGIPWSTSRTLPVHRYVLDDIPTPTLIKTDCEGGEWGFLSSHLGGVEWIVGELHAIPGMFRDEFRVLLAPTHNVSFSGPAIGCCSFLAVRNA